MSAPRRLALVLAAGLLALAVSGSPLSAQEETDELALVTIEATPLGALPPLGLPMPASRNHNYLVLRVQAGHRTGRHGADLLAVAGGVDLQWRGGSIFGLTGGYQVPDCETQSCDGHAFYGARARFNVVTGGPTIAGVVRDYSATSTLGAEIGFGYAPDARPGFDACTLDVGMPLSVAMLQTVRVVAFVTPTASVNVDCGSGYAQRSDLLVNAGVGIQQLWLRGLDVHLGVQRIFREGTGYQLGISVMYVHLP